MLHKCAMIVLIDNYDSFTYNLVQYFGDLDIETQVFRNDEKTADEILDLPSKGIVLSPGPCAPEQAGICLDLVSKAAATKKPLFGVCLGHQAIGQAFGGKIVKTPPMHGKVDSILHKGQGLFKDIESPLNVTRYHSLIVERETLPDDLTITAETQDGIIMGLQHKTLPIHGVQFHPESIATQTGHQFLKNFAENI